MRHPEILIVPALMLADYWLTVLSERRRTGGYREHYRHDHLELNPVLQRDVERGRWLSPRHLTGTALVALGLWTLTEPLSAPASLVDAVLGGALAFFGALVGNHLSNLLVFGEIRERPEGVEGTVRLSHEKTLRFSLYQIATLAVPVALLAALRPSAFLWGALTGVLLLVVAHAFWLTLHRRRSRSSP